MTQLITRDAIRTYEGGVEVFCQTRAEVLAELRAYRADNNHKFEAIFAYKIAQMNAAKN